MGNGHCRIIIIKIITTNTVIIWPCPDDPTTPTGSSLEIDCGYERSNTTTRILSRRRVTTEPTPVFGISKKKKKKKTILFSK